MHQMVLLHDVLLPFQNYEDILIPFGGEARGIGHLESARSQFLAELLTTHITQQGVVKYAKALLAPGLLHSTSGGDGLPCEHGVVLPAFLSGVQVPCIYSSISRSRSSPARLNTFSTVRSRITTPRHASRFPRDRELRHLNFVAPLSQGASQSRVRRSGCIRRYFR